MNNDVPLICDPVPGADVFCVPFEDDLSTDELGELKARWIAASEAGLPPEEMRRVIGNSGAVFWSDRFEWPDAEFCAA